MNGKQPEIVQRIGSGINTLTNLNDTDRMQLKLLTLQNQELHQRLEAVEKQQKGLKALLNNLILQTKGASTPTEVKPMDH